MNCPYCKTPLLGELTVCPKCKYDTTLPNGGEAHIRWIKENEEIAKATVLPSQNGEKRYGTGWMKFYIHWRFPIGMLFGVFNLISSFISIIGAPSQLPSIIFFFLIWDVLTFVFLFPVYVNMLKMNSAGYNLNILLLVIESVNLALRSALRQVQTGTEFAFALLIALPLGFLIWFLPNYIYFKNRKFMFDGRTVTKDITTNEKAPVEFPALASTPEDDKKSQPTLERLSKEDNLSSFHDTILFCRYCGSRIDENSSFCKKCGKKLSSDPIEEPDNCKEDETETIHVPFESLPPKLYRAFLFLEDEEWARADQYFESILDEEPTNAYAYLGKAMADHKIRKTSDLVKAEEIKKNRNYQKAIRFAMGDLKKQLDAI